MRAGWEVSHSTEGAVPCHETISQKRDVTASAGRDRSVAPARERAGVRCARTSQARLETELPGPMTPTDPLTLFQEWYAAARQTDLPEPSAAALATVGS